MKIRLAAELQTDSIVDGLGIRTVIWTQGCSHNCKACHNPETHSFKDGKEFDIEEIKKKIANLEYQDGVTFSGGDPMFQPEACSILAKFIKEKGMNIWCYTGFTFEELLKMSKKNKYIMEFLKNIDILVDGKFELDKKSYNIKFRGSTNQRLIDVAKSLKYKQIFCIDLEQEEPITRKNYTHQGVFI